MKSEILTDIQNVDISTNAIEYSPHLDNDSWLEMPTMGDNNDTGVE